MDLGFSEPDGMQIARFNIYLSDTGVSMAGQPLDVPPGAGGITTTDPDGWPMVVIPADTFDMDVDAASMGWSAPGEAVEVALAHELHHASQFAAGNARHRWWMEGMANWAATRQVPETIFTWQAVLALRAMPELPWTWDAWVDIDSSEALFFALRPYATMALPLHLSADLGLEDVVVQWAEDEGSLRDPLAGLDALLEPADLDLATALLGTWGALRSRELAGSERFAWVIEHAAIPDGLDHDPTFTLALDAEAAPPTDRRAGAFGANVVRVDAEGVPLRFVLEADDVGSEGTPVAWGAAAVWCGDGACRAEVLGLGDTWDAAADVTELVLMPVAEGSAHGEVFDYRLFVEPAPQACGCATSRGVSPWVLLFILVPAVRRREARCTGR